MKTSIEQHLNLRQQLIREAGSLNEPQLLTEALAFIRQLQTRDTPPKKGSAAALMQHFGTMSVTDAREMEEIIDREFNHIEGE